MSQTLPPGLRARVLDSAAKERAAPPGAWARRVVGVLAVSAVWLGVAYAMTGRRGDWDDLSPAYALGTVVALLTAALVLSTVGLSRGRAMLGPPVSVQLGLAVGLPFALAAWSFVVPSAAPTSFPCSSTADALRLAKTCDLLSLVLAAPMLGALLFLRRGTQAAVPALTGACLGAAAATWAHLVMHAHCPTAHPVHVLVGHALPLLPVMLAGALVGRRVFR